LCHDTDCHLSILLDKRNGAMPEEQAFLVT